MLDSRNVHRFRQGYRFRLYPYIGGARKWLASPSPSLIRFANFRRPYHRRPFPDDPFRFPPCLSAVVGILDGLKLAGGQLGDVSQPRVIEPFHGVVVVFRQSMIAINHRKRVAAGGRCREANMCNLTIQHIENYTTARVLCPIVKTPDGNTYRRSLPKTMHQRMT